MMQSNHQRVRITVSIPAEVARQLDEQRAHTEMNRSEAVAEAVTEWVERGIEADRERITGQTQAINQLRRELVAQTMLSVQEIAEMLKYQFSGLAGFEDQELERRAREALATRTQVERRRQSAAQTRFTQPARTTEP